MARLKELYSGKIKGDLREKFGYKNVHQIPKLEKIVLNCVTRDAVSNSKIAWIRNLELTTDFFSMGKDSNLVNCLKEFFTRHFYSWLCDLRLDTSRDNIGHQRAFTPFQLNFELKTYSEGRKTTPVVTKKDLLDVVTNIPAKRITNFFGKVKPIEIDEILNKLSDSMSDSENVSNNNQRFMNLLQAATQEIFKERYSNHQSKI